MPPTRDANDFAWVAFPSHAGLNPFPFNFTHSYDPAGNRVSQNDGTTVTTYSYSAADRLTLAQAGTALTTYQNDAAGNRTKVQDSMGVITYYAWDAPGHLADAQVPGGTATFTYNAAGQRTAKVGTDDTVTRYLYDFSVLLRKAHDDGSAETTYSDLLEDGGFDLVSEFDDEGMAGTHYYQFDAAWSVEAQLDSTGVSSGPYGYSAFGLAKSSAALTGPTFGFGGQKGYFLDPETQLYLLGMGAGGRYYDPATARFLSEDPLRFDAGDVDLYRFVGNNPVNRNDPSGKAEIHPYGTPMIIAVRPSTGEELPRVKGYVLASEVWSEARAQILAQSANAGVRALAPNSPAALMLFEHNQPFRKDVIEKYEVLRKWYWERWGAEVRPDDLPVQPAYRVDGGHIVMKDASVVSVASAAATQASIRKGFAQERLEALGDALAELGELGGRSASVDAMLAQRDVVRQRYEEYLKELRSAREASTAALKETTFSLETLRGRDPDRTGQDADPLWGPEARCGADRGPAGGGQGVRRGGAAGGRQRH